jgi:rubrerythrin
MNTPENEQGVVALFAQNALLLGYEIHKIQIRYPDALLRKVENGHVIRAEFEYRAANFKAHGHNPDECDLIVCWENNWPDSPVEVLAMADELSSDAIMGKTKKADDLGANASKWAVVAAVADRRLTEAKENMERIRRECEVKQDELSMFMQIKKHMAKALEAITKELPKGQLSGSGRIGRSWKPWTCNGCGTEIAAVNDGTIAFPCACCGEIKRWYPSPPPKPNKAILDTRAPHAVR